ncbi:hypothetical protein CBNA_1123 [Coxiella burnetii str. Namibia]|nr:hypothetical protein CBNA_1123 [Coxiella burnetii str. Namibia]
MERSGIREREKKFPYFASLHTGYGLALKWI